MSRTINTQDLLQLIHRATSRQDIDKSEELASLINTAVSIMALNIRRKFVACDATQYSAIDGLQNYIRNHI